MVTTAGANGRFVVPVRASQPFTLRILGLDGAPRGLVTGVAPGTGSVDVGDPFGAPIRRLTLTAEPGANSVVDPSTPVVFRFSEPIDPRGLASAIVVLDDGGSRVFGTTSIDSTGLTATFKPSRRWRYGTAYRYAVATTLNALSGARLASPFSGGFTTFRPSVVSTLDIGDTRDVAVSGGLAVAATATGLATVNLSSPLAPALHSHVSIPGGAGGVALLPQASIVDRTGATRTGAFAIIAGGSETTAGVVRTFDVGTPITPTSIGSAQVTRAPGTSPPSPVPPLSGTPRSVVVDIDNRALVAIEDVGVASVSLGQSVPTDSTNPGGALGPRYPAGTESASQVIRLGDRLVVAGAAGLTVLDRLTLVRRGGVSTEGDAQGVAGLAGFQTDVNGDGTVAPTERFDFAAVANGSDGTVQFYRIPVNGDPVLLSVVRLGAETAGVSLDPIERIAYVSLGNRGLGLVDLDGGSSIQPIDLDRNGLDDRILGFVDTPGTARRVALDLSRGLGLVADGHGGLAVAQLTPPRVAFLSLLRDPLRGRNGDEASILTTGEALTTDEAILVQIDAATAGQALVFSIRETPDAGGGALLSVGEDTTVTLQPGLNALVIDIAQVHAATGSRASLDVTTATGARLASFELRLRPPPAMGTLALHALILAPEPAVILANRRTLQLSVGGFFSDGTILNLTPSSRGTRYASGNPIVATVDAEGLVTALAGGVTTVTISNGSVRASLRGHVDLPPVLAALVPTRSNITLTAAGQGRRLELQALFSDGTVVDAGRHSRAVFTSSDPSIVEVGPDGTLIARAEGVATITVTNGSLQQQVQIAVEFSTPASVTGISLAPLADITTDTGEIVARAVISGTGTLHGVPIVFSIPALAPRW